MVDADGKLIAKNKHLLSLKDLNQLDNLEQLLDAGASSFKIEGRLKDAEYVKNVTAAYRKQLDAIFRRRPEYRRSSSGKSTYTFTPQVDKSFNRGFTNFFINGRQQGIEAFDTQNRWANLSAH
jgi:putative protease